MRDAISFLLGLLIICHEAFVHQLDRPGLLIVAAGLMGYGLGKFNGRREDEPPS